MIIDFNVFDLTDIAIYAERQHCVKTALQVASKKHDVKKYRKQHRTGNLCFVQLHSTDAQ